MPQLVFIDGKKIGTVVDLAERTSLGRGADNSVVLDEKGVAEHHAEIRRNGAQFAVVRRDPAARLAINGQPVEERDLAHGDIISVGDVTILFSDEVPQESSKVLLRKETPAASRTTIESRIKYIEGPDAILDALRKNQERLAGRLETLYRVGTIVDGTLDQGELTERLIAEVASVFHADRVFLVLQDELGQLHVEREFIGERSRLKGSSRVSRTILAEATQKREAILTQDALADERFSLKASIIDQNIQSAMCVPILKGDQVLGVIHVDLVTAGKAYTKDDLQLLMGISNQAALGLENVRAYAKRVEYSQALTKLADAARRMFLLMEQPEAVAKACVEDACRIFDCQKGSLFLLEKAAGTLRVAYSNWIDPDKRESIRIPLGEGHSGRVVAENRPILQTDTRVVKPGEVTAKRPYQTSSFLIVPVPGKESDIDPEVRPIGAISLADKRTGKPFDKMDLELLRIFGAQVGTALSNAELFNRATVDALTRVYARPYFLIKLGEQVAAHLKGGRPLHLLMVDIDLFKTVNDTYGHQAGDQVLGHVGKVLLQVGAAPHFAGRYGGEEFTVLLTRTGPDEALRLAEELRRACSRAPVRTEYGEIPVTVSVGVAGLEPSDTPEGLLRKSDLAMYQAKRKGRNRVETYLPSQAPMPGA